MIALLIIMAYLAGVGGTLYLCGTSDWFQEFCSEPGASAGAYSIFWPIGLIILGFVYLYESTQEQRWETRKQLEQDVQAQAQKAYTLERKLDKYVKHYGELK